MIATNQLRLWVWTAQIAQIQQNASLKNTQRKHCLDIYAVLCFLYFALARNSSMHENIA